MAAPPPETSRWADHIGPLTNLLERLGADGEQGLSSGEAARRLAHHGPNALDRKEGQGPWKILLRQLTSVLMLILLAAAAASLLVGDPADAVAILVILGLNAGLGFHQEYRAERAVAALRRLAVPTVKVVRDGRERLAPSPELVPGDVILLEAGDAVPADARLLSTHALKVEEAALTGESQPVLKDAHHTFPPAAEVPLGDRCNVVHRGTLVVAGHGRAVVTATGMATQLGRIASLIRTVERDPSPLSRRLDRLGRRLALLALVLVAVIFTLGVLRGEPVHDMLLLAISLAVAAVPEGLPAVVTIALALGAQRMLLRRALIRKLPAVETLGSVTVICSDKTGTLTENRMRVAKLAVAGRVGDRPEGPGEVALLAAAALCSDAHRVAPASDSAGERAETVGDPTEVALVEAAAAAGLEKAELEAALPRIGEVPFDSKRKRMTTVHRLPTTLPDAFPEALEALAPQLSSAPARAVAFTKGGLKAVLDRCSAVWSDVGDPHPLDDALRSRIAAAHDHLADSGARVLSAAFRPLPRVAAWEGSSEGAGSEESAESVESELIFLGLLGLMDPPREEVPQAVATCRRAGIRPVLITGDHPRTARAIARRVGILSEQDRESEAVVEGTSLNHLSDDELETLVGRTALYARVAPEHKLRLVQALQRRGEVVAMTGDGVNDAPALKRADIGVAMGLVGTDVAKEAADMVLRDDNFATLVTAVEEGRRIYDNIRKFVKFLLTSNSGEIWVMLLGPLLGLPLPLLPLQILWMNLVTDGLPALALGVEPTEKDVMRRPPRPPAEGILGRGLAVQVLVLGLLLGVVTLSVGAFYWHAEEETWRTVLFTTLVFAQLSLALAARSERTSFFEQGAFSNPPLLGAVLLSSLLHLTVVYLPPLQGFFATVPLSLKDLGVALAVGSLPFWALEGWKWGMRKIPPMAGRGSVVSSGRGS